MSNAANTKTTFTATLDGVTKTRSTKTTKVYPFAVFVINDEENFKGTTHWACFCTTKEIADKTVYTMNGRYAARGLVRTAVRVATVQS